MTTPAQITRYQTKSRAIVEAWASLFGVTPSLRELVRVMAVAEHESHMGDARGWKGEHNWGAIQKRSLSAIERFVLDVRGVAAGKPDSDTSVSLARALLPAGPSEALHVDSSPKSGPYFVWFWTFASDAEAARKFLQVLVVQHPAVRAVLEHDDVTELARAMYESGYYEGFHKNDKEANVRDYARRLAELEPLIWGALSAALPPPFWAWTPPAAAGSSPGHAAPSSWPYAASWAVPPALALPLPSPPSTRSMGIFLGVVTLMMFTVFSGGKR